MAQQNNIRRTFWELINNYVVEIPQIQRDYAQGRDSALDLRNRFLNRILESLKTPENNLRLDFIYGDTFTINGKKGFHPLDGQQRLTTLWLLHWYVALKAAKLKSQKEKFRQFRYMVRESSDAFLQFLCDFELTCAPKTLCKTIREQNGFYSIWQQDPTVVSILNMLDSIEDRFSAGDDFVSIWELLTNSAQCPIFFYLLPLKDIGHTDDLYIKMNARGKPLSSYENFKADLVKEIRDHNWGAKLEYSTLLDGKWTDVFWKYRLTGTSQIDEIYLAFITRYLSHVFICEGKASNGGKISEDSLKKEDPIEWRLYQEAAAERGESIYKYEYTSFDPYRSLITEEELVRLKHIFENITQIGENVRRPSWEEKNPLTFIPQYDDSEHITMLTMKQRLAFHGICCYLRIEGFDAKTFSQWMRIVWNLSENLNTESTLAGLFGALRTIDELGAHSHGIYEWFDSDGSIDNDYGRAQVFEEREKAIKIMKAGTAWEEKIKAAEKEYNGAIRFLFLDENSKVNWEHFDKKREKLAEILTKDGVTEPYQKDAVLLKALVSYCDRWTSQLESWSGHYRYVFGFDYDTWRDNILLRVDDTIKNDIQLIYASPVHHILMGDLMNPKPLLINAEGEEDQDSYHKHAYETLIYTDILNDFNGPRYYVRWYRSNLCLYPSSEGVMLTMNERDGILSTLIDSSRIELTRGNTHKSSGRTVIDGWDVWFIYKGREFTWYVDNGQSQIRIKTDEGSFDYTNLTGCGFSWNRDNFEVNAFVQKLEQAVAQLATLATNQSSESLTVSTQY